MLQITIKNVVIGYVIVGKSKKKGHTRNIKSNNLI